MRGTASKSNRFVTLLRWDTVSYDQPSARRVVTADVTLHVAETRIPDKPLSLALRARFARCPAACRPGRRVLHNLYIVWSVCRTLKIEVSDWAL